MTEGQTFQPVLDRESNNTAAEKVVLCSGKHYYTLLEAVTKASRTDVALVRVEELSPFPREKLGSVLGRYSSANEVVWAQEEPANQGAWTYVKPRLEELLLRTSALKGVEGVKYAGRKECATTATGVGSWHKVEAEEIVRAALA